MLERRNETGRAVRAEGSEANEVRLIGQIAGGDRLAFTQLYRAYFPRLTRFLDRMTRKPTLIEEIINDTLLVVWQKAASFNHTSKVSTWVFAIAYRKALKSSGKGKSVLFLVRRGDNTIFLAVKPSSG